MASSKGRDTSTQRMNLKSRKPLIWIRPKKLSIEIEVSNYKFLSPPRAPAWKNVIRFAIDLLGVIILLAAAWFLLSPLLLNSHTRVSLHGAPQPGACVNLGGCFVNGGTSTVPALQPTTNPTPGVLAALTPSPSPEPGTSPTPVPTPSPSPTPSAAVLRAPSSFSMSHALKCATGQPGSLTLSNIGGTPLVWLEDKLRTSQHISISDPAKTYLIQPGKSVAAYVKCDATITPGQYNLQILYNGGSSSIAVIITA